MNLRAIAIGIFMLMLPTITNGQFFQYTKEDSQQPSTEEIILIVEEWSIIIEEHWVESDSPSLLKCHTSFSNWLEFLNKQRIADTSPIIYPVSYPPVSPVMARQKDLSPLISLFTIK